jgi:hypothetical protein
MGIDGRFLPESQRPPRLCVSFSLFSETVNGKLPTRRAADPSPTRKRWDFCTEPRERHGCGTRVLRKVPAATPANVVKLFGLLVELVIELPLVCDSPRFRSVGKLGKLLSRLSNAYA